MQGDLDLARLPLQAPRRCRGPRSSSCPAPYCPSGSRRGSRGTRAGGPRCAPRSGSRRAPPACPSAPPTRRARRRAPGAGPSAGARALCSWITKRGSPSPAVAVRSARRARASRRSRVCARSSRAACRLLRRFLRARLARRSAAAAASRRLRGASLAACRRLLAGAPARRRLSCAAARRGARVSCREPEPFLPADFAAAALAGGFFAAALRFAAFGLAPSSPSRSRTASRLAFSAPIRSGAGAVRLLGLGLHGDLLALGLALDHVEHLLAVGVACTCPVRSRRRASRRAAWRCRARAWSS